MRALIATLGTAWALQSWTRAEPADWIREDFWVVDGNITALLLVDKTLFVGGTFDFIGSGYAGTAVQLDTVSGERTLDFPQANGVVAAVVSDGVGGWFVGGNFTRLGETARLNLAHILPDTSVDPDWRPEPNFQISALEFADGRLYVGGQFTTISGQSRSGAAALDPRTGAALAWNPAVTHRGTGFFAVADFAVTDDRVYLGGTFDTVGDQSRTHLAAVDKALGEPINWNPPSSGTVYAILPVDDTVFVGGNFTQVAGELRANIAAVDARSGRPTLWNPGANGLVLDIVKSCTNLYVVGTFTEISGVARHRAAALEMATARPTDWNPDADGPIRSMAFVGDRVYVGGDFTRISGTERSHVAALDVTTGVATDWSPRGRTPGVNMIALFGRRLFVGGAFGGGVLRRKNLAAFDTVTGEPTPWSPAADGGVQAFAAANNTLYIGGYFKNINGQPRAGGAAFRLDTGALTSWNPRAKTNITALAAANGLVYAGGPFSEIGGAQRNHIAALDTSAGNAVAWDPDANDLVRAILPSPGVVYAGGAFTEIAGNSLVGFAALNPLSGDAYLFDWMLDRALVLALTRTATVLFAGGGMYNSQGKLIEGLLAVDPITGQLLNWLPQVDHLVWSLGIGKNTLFVGGAFSKVGTSTRTALAAFDATTGALKNWAPSMPTNAVVLSVAADGDTLYAGGMFYNAAGKYRPGLAVFPPAGTPRILMQPRGTRVVPDDSVNLAVEAAGTAPLSYQWRLNAVPIPNATSPQLNIARARVADSGSYTVVVRNSLGQATSDEADVIVQVPPAITLQPQDQTVLPGATVALTIEASGSPPPAFQWRLNGLNIPGATGPIISLTNVQPTDGGIYSVVIANMAGVIASRDAEVLVQTAALPFADDLNARTVVSDRAGAGRGTNVGATDEAGEPSIAGKRGRGSVWFAWRAPANGISVFSTRGSSFDTLLAVYTNSVEGASATFETLGAVGADDDRGGFLTSEVVFNARSGTEYIVTVKGFAKASGNIVVSWRLDETVSEVPRVFQQPVGGTIELGQDATFSVAAFASTGLQYQWYFNCDPIPGADSPVLVRPNVDLRGVGRYTVGVTAGAQTVFSDSAYLELELGESGVAAQKTRSRDKLADFGSSGGPGLVRTMSFGFGGGLARGIPDDPRTQVFSTINSLKEPGEPNHCGEAGGASSWFSIKVEDSGILALSTEGSSFDTVLAVYRGPDNPLGFDELDPTPVACDDDSGSDGRTSRTSFPVTKGGTYHIAVDGSHAARGQVKLAYVLKAAPRIVLEPVDQSVGVGARVEFRVDVTNSPPWTFQWMRDGNSIPGATDATLVLTNVQLAQAGRYACIVKNSIGSVTSAEARLTITSSGRPRLTDAAMAKTGDFQFQIVGTEGARVVVEVSLDLKDWSPVATNVLGSTPKMHVELNAARHARRYFRVVQ